MSVKVGSGSNLCGIAACKPLTAVCRARAEQSPPLERRVVVRSAAPSVPILVEVVTPFVLVMPGVLN